jgi:hypothetical protein
LPVPDAFGASSRKSKTMMTIKALPETVSTDRVFGKTTVPPWATHIALITGAESMDNLELFERMVAAVAGQKKEETYDAWELGISQSRERVVVWWFKKSDAAATVINQSSIFPFTG